MPLGEPMEREAFHIRRISCTGYLRKDKLWDFEAHLLDTKGHDFDSKEKIVRAGEPVHNISVRVTTDVDYLIRDVEVSFGDAPHTICVECEPAYKRLIGLRIGPGFSRRLQELFGGKNGCIHVNGLIGTIAFTTVQTIGASLLKKEDTHFIDSCYGLRSDGEPVRLRYPEQYTGGKRD